MTEEEFIELEHVRGDGRKMYADTAWYRLTTPEENPDAAAQTRPGTLRGIAAAYVQQRGGKVMGRELHYYMLTQTTRGKWDYGYVHSRSVKNLKKRGADRDWLRRVDVSEAATLPLPTLARAPMRTARKTSDALLQLEQDGLATVERSTLPTTTLETRQNRTLVAYRKAEAEGTRFVIVANEAHVWLWDRLSGRTLREQALGRFEIDQLGEVLSLVAARAAQSPAASTAAVYPIAPSDRWPLGTYLEILKDVLRGIRLLRNDPKHVERAHERLVDHFLTALGFDPYTEIGFRNGRIDMTVMTRGRPTLAFEVKQDWSLNDKVFDQAYAYSVEHGIRFFAITNGDDYVIHDCWRSLRRAENEMHRFRLTELKEDDAPCLDWLRCRSFETK